MSDQKIIQINICLKKSLAEKVDLMAEEDGFDNRSAFLRRLIRLEIKRRGKPRIKKRMENEEGNQE